MPEQRWVFVIKAQDQPGALTAAAGVFSNRGVSLETILGSGMNSTSIGVGRFVLSFRATERKKDMLLRVVKRLSTVLQVDCYPYSSSVLRAIAVVRVSSATDINWEASDVQMEIVSKDTDSQTMLLTGGTPAVEQWVETLRERNTLLDVAMSVMAV
jgi:acetolactate synthase small subunit